MAKGLAAAKRWLTENPWKTLGFFAMFVTFAISVHPLLSPDVYMYVAIADNWLKHGLPVQDPFIIDPVKPFQIMHEWLSYFLFWGLHELGGFDATILFKSLLFAAMSLVVTSEARRLQTHVLVYAAVLGLALFSAHFRMTERTSIFSDFFQLLTLGLAMRLYLEENLSFKKTASFVFVLFALWTNLHAGWLFGLTLLAAGASFRWWKKRDAKCFLLLPIVALAGLFVHPQGAFGVLYPFEFSQGLRKLYSMYYVEWAPIYVELLLNFIEVKVFLGFAGVFTLVALVASSRRSWTEGLFVLVLLGIVVAPTFMHSRFVVVSSFGLALITCFAFRDRESPRAAHVLLSSATAFAVSAFFVVWPIPGQSSPVKLGTEVTLMPTTVLEELGKLPEGNVFNSHEFGGAIAWRYEGRYKVVFHGFDTDPARFLNDYLPAFESEAACLRAIQKYRIRYFFLDKHGGAAAIWKFLEKHGWQIRAYDSAAVLLTPPTLLSP